MLKNYFKIAVRNLRKHPGYSFINIGGLTIGMVCCMLIFQYVAFEHSYDTFNDKATEIYRVNQSIAKGLEEKGVSATTGHALGPSLKREIPEVIDFTRLHPEYDTAVIFNPDHPDRVFEEEQVFYADSSFFRIFSYPLIAGDPRHALTEPGTAIISETAAAKYFGTESPLGKVLEVEGWISGAFRVSGIFKDVPPNSHLQFDFLLPMIDLLRSSQYSNSSLNTGWGWTNFLTYVQLSPDAEPREVERKFTDLIRHKMKDALSKANKTAHASIQRLTDIHLNEDISAPKTKTGSARAVYFFTIIGILTLLIALVNYINLTTARAIKRSREVGVRKTIGAQKWELIIQFLCESALMISIACALAFTLSQAFINVVNDLVATDLSNAMLTQSGFWIAFLTLFLFVTLLAGFYPAFILSSFRPAAVIKGEVAKSSTVGLQLRRGLVIFQFTAAITLLVGTAIVYNQLNYMQNMDLGMDLEQILSIPAPRVLSEGSGQSDAVNTFTRELNRIPSLKQIATSRSVPGQGFSFYTNNVRKATDDPSREVPGAVTWIDTSFISLYKLDLIAGEDLAHTTIPASEDEPDPVLINETLMQAVGFARPSDAVGQTLYVGGNRRIIGILKDFHWSSAHSSRENIVFFLSHNQSRISIKLTTENLPESISAIEQTYKELFPGNPFQYSFVDEQFDQQYKHDRRFAQLFTIFAGLALIIACLGLFGLAAFTAQQRTKEIGVRKVFGATISNIVGLLSRDFLKLVLVGFIISVPVSWYVMNQWLQDFAYRIEIRPVIFIMAGVVAMLIAGLTVSWQSLRIALANPARSLRSE